MNIEFPTLVYRTPGNHQIPGGTYDYKAAEDAPALDALLTAGWFLTLPEAIAGEHDQSRYDDAAPTREELEAKAIELEIKFDGRTTDKALNDKIEAALKAKE